MANEENAVVETKENKGTEAKAKEIKVVEAKSVDKNHKCLIYWHKLGVGSIPVCKGPEGTRRVNVFAGYNTVDFSDMTFIAEQCRDLINEGYITLHEISVVYDEDGKATVKEKTALKNISASELRKIINETTNPATLDDLGNPDVVGVKNQDLASVRKAALENATGLESENINVKA